MPDALPLLRETGCAFITSAVESLDDRGARVAREGAHARRLRACRRPVPRRRRADVADVRRLHAVDDRRWSYLDLLHEIDRLELVEHVSPIQYAIRLLVPQGSRMLELAGDAGTDAAVRSRLPDVPVASPRSAVDRLQEADVTAGRREPERAAAPGVRSRLGGGTRVRRAAAPMPPSNRSSRARRSRI